MDAACVTEFKTVRNPLLNRERMYVADHARRIYEVIADCGVRPHMILVGVDHVSRRGDKAAGLAFQGQVLRVRARGGKQRNRKGPAGCERRELRHGGLQWRLLSCADPFLDNNSSRKTMMIPCSTRTRRKLIHLGFDL